MKDEIPVTRTTLGEIRAILATQEVPMAEMQKFAENSIDGPNEAVIEIRIDGQFVTFSLVGEPPE